MQWACAVLSSAACPALQYFSSSSHKGHDFRIRKLLNIKCVFQFSLQLSSEAFLIPRRNGRDRIKMYIGLQVKYSLFLYGCTET